MTDRSQYDIPLSKIYVDNYDKDKTEEGIEGKSVKIETGKSVTWRRFDIIDRTGNQPDLISLSEGEVEELAHICLAYLNRTRDESLGGGAPSGQFEQFRTSHNTQQGDTDE